MQRVGPPEENTDRDTVARVGRRNEMKRRMHAYTDNISNFLMQAPEVMARSNRPLAPPPMRDFTFELILNILKLGLQLL
jgi:hypothetical protein